MRTLWLIIVALLLVASGCDQNTSHQHVEQSTQKYTCPMHPQVVSDHPGTCPICKMDLVAVTKGTAQQIVLNENQILLADIKTSKVKREPVGHAYFANGRIMNDETKTQKVSSRIAGRIDHLFIKETGTMMAKGAPIYELYSDELQVLQREFVLAVEQYDALGKGDARYREIMANAEKKLALYGVSNQQIDALRKNKKIMERIVYYSPASGYVSALNINEGQYVQEGQTLFEIQNNATLWVEAELYPSETSLVKEGDKVKVRVAGFESFPEDGTVTFLSPELRSNSQINMMRVLLDNAEGKYRPGMQAQVIFTSSTREAIAVPIDAVIRDGNGAHLYIMTARNTFEPRMVKTGSENVNVTEITDGLKEGEDVVVSGAYLLYSEIVLKKGNDVLQHNH